MTTFLLAIIFTLACFGLGCLFGAYLVKKGYLK